jgi:hypothetical protein
MSIRHVALLAAIVGAAVASSLAAAGPRGGSDTQAQASAAMAADQALRRSLAELATQLPAFARPWRRGDSPPGGARLFTTERPLAIRQARRVASAAGRAVFAAPAADGAIVCLAMMADSARPDWAATACESPAVMRTRPLTWTVSVAGNPARPADVFVWGIAAPDVARVSVRFGPMSASDAAPNANGAFIVDAGSLGYPEAIDAFDGAGARVATYTVEPLS